MTGITIGLYWQITLRFVAPVLIFVILTSSIIFQIMKSSTYNTWNQTNVTYYSGIYFMLSLIILPFAKCDQISLVPSHFTTFKQGLKSHMFVIINLIILTQFQTLSGFHSLSFIWRKNLKFSHHFMNMGTKLYLYLF